MILILKNVCVIYGSFVVQNIPCGIRNEKIIYTQKIYYLWLQEGVLELWVHFKDLQAVPLASFARSSYRVEIENETPTILALPSDDYKNRYVWLMVLLEII